MKSFKKKFAIFFVLAVCVCAICMFAAACGQGSDKEVFSVKCSKAPDKTEYYVGDVFSVEGAVLEVTYADKTTAELSFDAEGVEYTEPDMSTPGKKTITVQYGGKSARFSITVSEHGLKFIFDLNYDEKTFEKDVVAGYAVKEPSAAEIPSREGYTFYKWYYDKDCTVEYDFDTVITQDGCKAYAQWKEDGAVYFDVTFDFNYVGAKQRSFPQIVKSGEPAREPATQPVYEQHEFLGWSATQDGAVDFNEATPVEQSVTYYAKWNKVANPKTEYTFEAENVNLQGKSGPGYSGSNAGKNMIVPDINGTRGASGGKFVAYQGRRGCSLEFEIVADTECTATLIIRFAAESKAMTLTCDSSKTTGRYAKYAIEYGANTDSLQEIQYSDIELETMTGSENGAFAEYTIAKINLRKGANVIRLMTDNSNVDELGGTYAATAPAIDGIILKNVSDKAVVIWNGEKGYPFANL